MREPCWLMVSFLAQLLPGQRELLDALPKDGAACDYAYVGFGPEFSPIELPGEGTVPSEPGAWRGQEWPWLLASSAAAWIDGKLLLAGERQLGRAETAPIAGLLTPLPAPPSERLSLGLYLDAGSTRYEIGPKPLYSLGAVKQELQRIAVDPAARIVGSDGKPMLMPVVIEPHRGVTVAAVAAAWDVAKAAGFSSISSPAQEAWVLAERRKATK